MRHYRENGTDHVVELSARERRAVAAVAFAIQRAAVAVRRRADSIAWLAGDVMNRVGFKSKLGRLEDLFPEAP